MISSSGLCAMLACLWEASARKPGNVHPGRDFTDLTYRDLVLSAGVIAPVLARASVQPVGQTILEAIQATRRLLSTNSNLGIVLLLAPLAAVPQGENLRKGVEAFLDNMTADDSRNVFAAIRLAMPGGLGEAPEQDVHDEPTLPLRQIMALAQERDFIARQYANGFREVFEVGVPTLQAGLVRFGNLEEAIISCHLHFMARLPDSLIARKRGQAEAIESARQAQAVLDAGWPDKSEGRRLFENLDAWLTEVGHARNPGTSADLVAASLFVSLRENIMMVPPQYPWARPS